MRVLSSLLIAVQAEWIRVVKDPTVERSHAINKLATANKLANRLAIYSKGGNPDLDGEEFNPLYSRVQQHNNKYFNKLESVLMDGDCGLMYKPSKKDKETGRRRRSTTSSLALDADDLKNLCDDMEGEDDDACILNEDGSIAGMDNDPNSAAFMRRNKSFDLDPTKFVKNARKVHTSIKKFTTIFLQNCENEEGTRNDKRLKRNLIMLSRRVRDGIRAGYTTIEEVEGTKWKRLYPKTPKSGPDGKDGMSWSEFFMGKATPKTGGSQDE
jgi:hypothetical protein